jgi:RNA 2',3'-cyclic 3'-phosphodiesterase
MTDTPWRCFVAVPLGDDLRAALAGAVEAWRARADLGGLRWADPDGWHLTLAFLGAIEPATVAGVEGIVAAAATRHPPWRTTTGGLGGFPSARRARVAWYGVSDPGRRLTVLATDLRAALGLADTGRFRTHITLARARRDPVDLRGWAADALAPEGELAVDRLHLVRSHLGRGPAQYETLAMAPLGGTIRG